MLAKFGNVVYWIASIVAALMLGCAGLVWFTERQSGDFGTMFNLTLIGLAVWIIGRGCRYALART
jgi:hypothetical protein